MFATKQKNRQRLIEIRDTAPNAVEAFIQMLLDPRICDNGTPHARICTILTATKHRFIPALHTGLRIGLTGFRPEFEDPWPTSYDQVGHFLTAVRLSYNAGIVASYLLPWFLGGIGQRDGALRFVIGHEKKPDPPDPDSPNLASLITAIKHFYAQYHSVTNADLLNFRQGNLQAIHVGDGIGNSMADLLLSYKGWIFADALKLGQFQTKQCMADWVRRELAA